MNSSSVPALALQPRSASRVELAAQDLARRGDDVGAVVPGDVGEAQRRALLPRDAAQRVEVGAHARSRRSRAPTTTSRSRRRCSCRRRPRAGSCSPRRRARRPRRGSASRVQALALQAALHVGHREQDRVDRAALDLLPQLLERHGPRRYGGRALGAGPLMFNHMRTAVIGGGVAGWRRSRWRSRGAASRSSLLEAEPELALPRPGRAPASCTAGSIRSRRARDAADPAPVALRDEALDALRVPVLRCGALIAARPGVSAQRGAGAPHARRRPRGPGRVGHRPGRVDAGAGRRGAAVRRGRAHRLPRRRDR